MLIGASILSVCFSVDTNLGDAKAFLRSLHQQYADWGIDFEESQEGRRRARRVI
jgi:hypothetical protein